MALESLIPINRKPAPAQHYVPVDLGQLQIGRVLRCPLFYERNGQSVLLLAAGTIIDSRLIRRLTNHGVTRVLIDRRGSNGVTDTRAMYSTNGPRQTASISRLATANSKCNLGASQDSYLNHIHKHGASAYDAGHVQQFKRGYQKTVDQVDKMFDLLIAKQVSELGPAALFTAESLVSISQDLDLFVALGIEPAIDRYPFRHSTQTAMLAMAIGTMLGLNRDNLIELGVGALIHDAGMLYVKPELLESQHTLNRVQFVEITRHPMVTFELIRHLPHIPNGAQMVAYQMHERYNGTGYPHRRHSRHIHQLARVAAIADVYQALISPRPHRPGYLPYKAMETIVKGSSQGLYDPLAVRGLLHAIGLFPVGSYVELNDGRCGRVIRSNREAYTQPVVEIWNPVRQQTLDHDPQLVDLKKDSHLKVTRPVAQPSSGIQY
ncbi:MAG: HD domain-containing phosphohydrolase [Planctomycetaceae bacterium]